MYLARGFLNQSTRTVLRDLADPVAMHRTLLKLFPDDLGPRPREHVGLLYRIDAGPQGVLLVLQSRVRPDFGGLPGGYFVEPEDGRVFELGWTENPKLEDLGAPISAGTRCRFRLHANVTKKVGTKTVDEGKRKHGTRVPLATAEARIAWLARKGRDGGFELVDARSQDGGVLKGRRSDTTVTVAATRFDGVLVITDEVLFRKTQERGIGPAKSYGCGLLSVVPVS